MTWAEHAAGDVRRLCDAVAARRDAVETLALSGELERATYTLRVAEHLVEAVWVVVQEVLYYAPGTDLAQDALALAECAQLRVQRAAAALHRYRVPGTKDTDYCPPQ